MSIAKIIEEYKKNPKKEEGGLSKNNDPERIDSSKGVFGNISEIFRKRREKLRAKKETSATL